MTLTRILLAVISIFMLAGQAFSATKPKLATFTEAPIVMPRGPAKRLFIVGFSGAVVVNPVFRGDDVTIKTMKYIDPQDGQNPNDALSQLIIKATPLGDTLEIRAQLPPSAGDWQKWATGKHVPEAKLEIWAPDTMGLEIYWQRGDVKVSRWRAPVLITSQEGKVTADDISGDVTLHTMYGATHTENVKGSVNIENFSSALLASNINGKVKIKNFSGETHVRKVNGPVSISTQKGIVNTAETTGPMDVQTGVAAIHISEHKGALSGHSDTGNISAKITGPADARMTSVSGALTLSVPRKSSANVSMASSKGTVNAPHGLGEGKSVRGKLSGSESGHIRISSESGDIALKTF